MEPITRQSARAAGLRHFYTGKACKRGHIRERAVSTGSCLGCLAFYAREYALKFRTPKRAQLMGAVPITVHVRPAHQAAVEAFVGLLEHSVITGAPVPMVPAAADVASVNTFISMLTPVAPVPAPTANDPYPMWVRIHGKDIADQMRAGAV